jgi:putative membrane protein
MMGNGFGFGIPGLGMILIWGLIIGVVVWVIRAVTAHRPADHKSAREILDERYARGEIDRDELEQKRRDLSG